MKTLLALCALAACRSASAPPKPPPELDTILEKAVHDSHLVGLAAAVADHGNVVLEQGYGFTDVDGKTSITIDTVFEIGSLSKPFTAAAVLRLVDDGKLKLSDRAATYLPELPGDLTIQQLLWQTSGIPDFATALKLRESARLVSRRSRADSPDDQHGQQSCRRDARCARERARSSAPARAALIGGG